MSYTYRFVLFVNFYAIRYGDTVEQSTPTLVRANDITTATRFAKIIGANRAGKSARSLFNCISVKDGIKINEQYKSIGIGPLYLQTEFEAI